MIGNFNKRTFVCVAVLAMTLGCGDDESTAPDLVTISGIVRNIDTAQFAPGVRVSLYGTDYSDEVATGSDGAYSLKVPKGSVLHLHTDDFNTGQDDKWIRLINIELVSVIADNDMLDWPIHSCPQTTCLNTATPTEAGSVALFNHYLESKDQTNGNTFVSTSVEGSSGALIMLLGDCSNNVRNLDSMSVASNSPAFPFRYRNINESRGLCGDNRYFHAPSRTLTDAIGVAVSFGDPAFTGTTVTVTVNDRKALPFRNVPSPVEVPVHPGIISLVQGKSVNGAVGTFKNFACACLNPDVFCTP